MHPFEYARPATVPDAVRLLADRSGLAAQGTSAVAGATDLLSLLKDGVETPGRLVSLAALDGLQGIRRAGDALEIGALVTLADAAASPELRQAHPALAASFDRVGGPQIRAQGTVGGNLCQRPRCWYFRRGFGLLALRDGRSMVVAGENRYHAILGNEGPAYFVSPSTVVPLLVALEATVRVAGPRQERPERELPLADLYRVPREEGVGEIALGPGEVVTVLKVPSARGLAVASYEVRPGTALDWSLATASVALRLEGGVVRSARVVLGQVAPKPWESPEAAAEITGKRLTAETAAKAAAAAVAGAKPLSHNRYKIQLTRVAVERALLAAAGGGQGEAR